MIVRVGTEGVKITPLRGMGCAGCAGVEAGEADWAVDVSWAVSAAGLAVSCWAAGRAGFAKPAVEAVNTAAVATDVTVRRPVIRISNLAVTGRRLHCAATQFTLKLILVN
jgi:hypothetical protein